MLAQAANRIAGALYGDDEKRLTPEALIAAAAKATRLDAKPLTDPRLIEALGALTSSLHKEASLSPFGRLGAGWDLKRMLSTVLILAADAEREDRTILTRPLEAPIFIAGLPRSGTTFLHGLLAEDPANRAPRIWEAIYPYPKHRAAEFGAGRRMVQLQLGIFNRLSPGIRNLHPIEADAPGNASSLRARCSVVPASTTSIAPHLIEPGSTRLATTMAIGSLRGSSVIFRDRAKRRDAGS
jgi:hypothetical protein